MLKKKVLMKYQIVLEKYSEPLKGKDYIENCWFCFHFTEIGTNLACCLIFFPLINDFFYFKFQPAYVSSSEESDSEMPALKELMAEIGVKQEEPESEQESEEESEGSDNENIEENGEENSSENEQALEDGQKFINDTDGNDSESDENNDEISDFSDEENQSLKASEQSLAGTISSALCFKSHVLYSLTSLMFALMVLETIGMNT